MRRRASSRPRRRSPAPRSWCRRGRRRCGSGRRNRGSHRRVFVVSGASRALQQCALHGAGAARAPQVRSDAVQARAVVGPAAADVARQDRGRRRAGSAGDGMRSRAAWRRGRRRARPVTGVTAIAGCAKRCGNGGGSAGRPDTPRPPAGAPRRASGSVRASAGRPAFRLRPSPPAPLRCRRGGRSPARAPTPPPEAPAAQTGIRPNAADRRLARSAAARAALQQREERDEPERRTVHRGSSVVRGASSAGSRHRRHPTHRRHQLADHRRCEVGLMAAGIDLRRLERAEAGSHDVRVAPERTARRAVRRDATDEGGRPAGAPKERWFSERTKLGHEKKT
jgi:hypothetical protein